MKVYFKYATMGSGKSAKACIVARNYQEQGLKALCIIPATDTRHQFERESGDLNGRPIGKIASRIEGLEQKAYVLPERKLMTEDMADIIEFADVIIIDEAQFLSKDQVTDIVRYSLEKDKPVICYGLLTTFKTELFEGSKRFIELGAKLEHLKSVGTNGKSTVVNARFNDGEIQTTGEDIEVGGNERYRAISLQEYFELVKP